MLVIKYYNRHFERDDTDGIYFFDLNSEDPLKKIMNKHSEHADIKYNSGFNKLLILNPSKEIINYDINTEIFTPIKLSYGNLLSLDCVENILCIISHKYFIIYNFDGTTLTKFFKIENRTEYAIINPLNKNLILTSTSGKLVILYNIATGKIKSDQLYSYIVNILWFKNNIIIVLRTEIYIYDENLNYLKRKTIDLDNIVIRDIYSTPNNIIFYMDNFKIKICDENFDIIKIIDCTLFDNIVSFPWINILASEDNDEFFINFLLKGGLMEIKVYKIKDDILNTIKISDHSMFLLCYIKTSPLELW